MSRWSLLVFPKQKADPLGPPGRFVLWVWLGRRTLPGKLDESAEGIRVVDRQLGKHLAIDLDAGLAQAVHELRVAHPLAARGGVDADDPQPPEVALAVAPVTVGVGAGALHLLLGEAVGRLLAAPV